jgi:acetyl esterase/lipase
MPFELDPEVAKALEPMITAMGEMTPPPVGDIASRRTVNEAIMAQTGAAQPVPDDVTITDYHTTARDGARLLLRWYTTEAAAPGPAVLYLHGGGMITGSVALYDARLSRQVSRSGVRPVVRMYRPTPLPPARPTWPACRPPTSRSGSWTSSATRTCPMRCG